MVPSAWNLVMAGVLVLGPGTSLFLGHRMGRLQGPDKRAKVGSALFIMAVGVMLLVLDLLCRAMGRTI